MFCSQCGTKNNDDAKFCSSCGTAVAAAISSPSQSSDKRQVDMLPAKCPNCSYAIWLDSLQCPKCKAEFSDSKGWKPIPMTQAEAIANPPQAVASPPRNQATEIVAPNNASENFAASAPQIEASPQKTSEVIIFGGGFLALVVASLVVGFIAVQLGFIKEPIHPPSRLVISSIVTEDYNNNRLRALEKYAKDTVDVVGFFHGVQTDRNVTTFFIPRVQILFVPNLLYAVVGSSDQAEVSKLNKGQLIAVTCEGLGTYGMSPQFSKCRNPRPYPLNGERPAVVFDRLLWDQNPANSKAAIATPPKAASAAEGRNECRSNIEKLRSDLIVILTKVPAMPPLAKISSALKDVFHGAEKSLTEGKYAECVEDTERALKVSRGYAH